MSVPLNGYLAGLMRKFQLQQMKLKDKRIKLMNEILGGMKVILLLVMKLNEKIQMRPFFLTLFNTVTCD